MCRRMCEVLLVVALVAGGSGCQRESHAGAVSFHRGNSCSAKPRNPHRSSGTSTDIVAKAELGCDRPVERLYYEFWLQRETPSGWATVRYRDDTLFGAQAPVSRPIIRQVATACAPGRFRLVVQIRATYSGQTKIGGKSYSGVVTNPCATGGGGGSHGSW